MFRAQVLPLVGRFLIVRHFLEEFRFGQVAGLDFLFLLVFSCMALGGALGLARKDEHHAGEGYSYYMFYSHIFMVL